MQTSMRQWSFVFFDLTMWNSPPSGSFWCDFVLTTVPCHLLFTTVNSSYRAWAAAKIIFFRIVMKLPSTDVTFLLCSKLSVYFLTYLLSRPAAMHCSTHVTRGDNVLYAFVRRRQFEQRCSPATRLFSEGAWIGCKRVAFICSNCTIVG